MFEWLDRTLVSELATGITVLFAGGGIWLANRNVSRTIAVRHTILKQNIAFSAYQKYLELAVKEELFAGGDLDAIRRAGRERSYGFFVSALVLASEQILEAFPGERAWMDTVENQVALHEAWFLALDERDLTGFTTGFRAVIETRRARDPNAASVVVPLRNPANRRG